MKKIFSLLAVVMMAVGVMADTVYFVNKAGYTDPHCYAWTGGTNNAWPGVKMTKENYQLAGADVYSYTADVAYENCIFNNGGQPQTDNLTWTSGKYFDGTSWKTRAELEGNQGGGGGQGQGGGQTGDDVVAHYLYKGNINGDGGDFDCYDHNECEFIGGKTSMWTTSFTSAAIFVIYQVHGQEGVQYMASQWDYPAVDHCTLSVNGGGNYQKWNVPVGTTNLYLYDNGDGTLEISAKELPGKTLVQAETDFDQVVDKKTVNKSIVNGQLVITIDGVRYNANGVRL